jgi:hypothetical protein
MISNFTKITRDVKLYIQKAQGTSNRLKLKHTHTHTCPTSAHQIQITEN